MKSIISKKTTSPVETSSKILFGITLIILLVFLFSLFVPFSQIKAETITVGSLYANQLNLDIAATTKTGATTKITATISDPYSKVELWEGYVLKFYAVSLPISYKPYGFRKTEKGTITPETTCTIKLQPDNKYYCYVYFSASEMPNNQTFNIDTFIYKSEADYKNNPIGNARADIKITGLTIKITPPVTPPPTPPVVKTNTTYTPLAPLPGLGDNGTSFETDKSKNACPFGNYLNIMIKLILGIAAVLAMVMITMGGIQYMTSDLVSSKEAGKETATNAILGLLIGLGAWLILNTINPALLSACLDKLPQAEIVIEPESAHEQIVLTNIKNFKGKDFVRTSYYGELKKLIGTKFPHCMMQANMLIESAGKTSKVIGHDENVKMPKVQARKDFVKSGITFKKIPFNVSTDIKIPQQNDDGRNSSTAPDSNDTHLGIDYTRFSHSVGMFGATFFPPNGTITGNMKKEDGTPITMQDIYNNKDNADLKFAIKLMENNYTFCKKDVLQTFKIWQGGKCNADSALVLASSGAKMDLYNKCLTQDK